MTYVDDNLPGTGPIRSAKPGSKSAGKPLDAANQQSAFQNAFADAGKKKQPIVSINAKPAAEAGAQAQNSVANTLKSAEATDKARVPAKDRVTGAFNADPVDVETNDRASLRKTASRDAVAMDALKTPSTPDLPVSNEILPEIGEVSGKLESVGISPEFTSGKSKNATGLLPSVSLVEVGVDAQANAGKKLEGPAGEKIADLFKDRRAQLSKSADTTEKADDASPPGSVAPAEAAPADVSQLLTLLGAARTAAASTAVPLEATPAMSEFQALAERAGKARAKDGQAAKIDTRASGEASAAGKPVQAGSDQVFRFARADGKGQAVSMTVRSDGDKTAVKNDAPATQAKAETVTVLEARRYLGLAPTSNAAAVTSQIAGNPEWARALQPGAADRPLTQAATGKALDTLKIQMHPIDLGTVTATLRLKDDELSVEIKVETGEAFRQLSDDQSAMVKALRAQGFAVDQVNIVFNASDTSGGNNSQQQAQSQTGQQGRETAAEGQGNGQRNDNDGSQGQGRERWMGNEGSGDASSAAELNRAGDVYM